MLELLTAVLVVAGAGLVDLVSADAGLDLVDVHLAMLAEVVVAAVMLELLAAPRWNSRSSPPSSSAPTRHTSFP